MLPSQAAGTRTLEPQANIPWHPAAFVARISPNLLLEVALGRVSKDCVHASGKGFAHRQKALRALLQFALGQGAGPGFVAAGLLEVLNYVCCSMLISWNEPMYALNPGRGKLVVAAPERLGDVTIVSEIVGLLYLAVSNNRDKPTGTRKGVLR